MIKSIRSRSLKRFAGSGDMSKLPVQNADRVRLLLLTLDGAVSPEAMNLPGFGFHGLQGKPKRYAVTVNGNYRMTFGFDGEDAIDVDLEDFTDGEDYDQFACRRAPPRSPRRNSTRDRHPGREAGQG